MSYIAQMVSDFTGSMREAALDEWQTATTHRLFGEITADSVSDADFERYLRIEFAFIDTAAIALGAAVRIAPDMADRVVLAAIWINTRVFTANPFRRHSTPAEADGKADTKASAE